MAAARMLLVVAARYVSATRRVRKKKKKERKKGTSSPRLPGQRDGLGRRVQNLSGMSPTGWLGDPATKGRAGEAPTVCLLFVFLFCRRWDGSVQLRLAYLSGGKDAKIWSGGQCEKCR